MSSVESVRARALAARGVPVLPRRALALRHRVLALRHRVLALRHRVLALLAALAVAALALAALALAASPALAQPLSLDDALRIAETRSARIAAQSAAVNAAGELVARAGELPDPKLVLGIENLPVSGTEAWRWDQDSMTMRRIGIEQGFPSPGKRRALGARAQAEERAESTTLAASRLQVRREVAVAWFELRYAEEEHAALAALERETELEAETAAAAVAGGRLAPADALAARAAVEQVRDRLAMHARTLERSRIALAQLVGEAASRPLGAAPDTAVLPESRRGLLVRLNEHPGVRAAERQAALAQADIAVAGSTKTPDWSLIVSYGQRSPNFSNMVSVMVAIDLPIAAARRQDRDIAAKQALAERARSAAEDARRTAEAEARALVADWETALARVNRYEHSILPLARERIALALAAYRGGRGTLAGVLEARRAEAEARMGLAQALADRARAWSAITNLLLEEGTS
jgi:outer membrane protein TolC